MGERGNVINCTSMCITISLYITSYMDVLMNVLNDASYIYLILFFDLYQSVSSLKEDLM